MTTFPNLGDVITTDDLGTFERKNKKTGQVSLISYVNWCRVAYLLQKHAPGWFFHLRQPAPDSHVWQAPDGTGYLIGYFEGPDGKITPDFPQAVMDGWNNPMPMAAITARDLTDTHRRCLCTAAAATFGLAWQLWAKEPVENPYREEDDFDQKQRDAIRKVQEQGLRTYGYAAMYEELGSTSMADMRPEYLDRLVRQGAQKDAIDRWNERGKQIHAARKAEKEERKAAATPAAVANPQPTRTIPPPVKVAPPPVDDGLDDEPIDDDPPMAWDVPADTIAKAS